MDNIVNLKDLSCLITKGTTPSNIGENFTDTGIMYFRSELVGKTKFIDKSSGLLFISPDTHNKLKRSQIEYGDILFSIAGAYLGKVSLVGENDIPSNTNQAVAIIRLQPDLCDREYIYYYMKQKWFNEYVNSLNAQAAQPNINLTQIGKLKVLLPPKQKQNNIVEILSAYDKLIENNNRRVALLEKASQELYKEWFVRFRFPGYETAKFENGLPEGWGVYQAQDLFDISIGRTPDRKQFDYFTTNKDDALWVSISDMKNNMFVTKSSEYLTDEAIKKVNMPMLEEDTVLLSFKLSVGRVSITTKLSCTNEAIAHFKTNDKELLEYTYLYLKLFNYQNLGNTSAIGNAVNSTIIKKMKFLLPNRELIQKFHECTNDIFAQIKNIINKNENLMKQRDLLLPRLINGKLEV